MRFSILVAAMFAVSLSTHAKADHWMQTTDFQTLQKINHMLSLYEMSCKAGNTSSCSNLDHLRRLTVTGLNAEYTCKTSGEPEPCEIYNRTFTMLGRAYYHTEQAVQGGVQAGLDTSDRGHADRMRQIHNWGQQRLQYGRDSMAIMEQRQQQFLNSN